MTLEFGSPRTAIVTGGARRIGAALVEALAADGWHVLIHCRESCDEADAVLARIGPGRGRVVAADLSLPECAERVFAGLKGMPPLGLLVNNASRFVYDSLDDFTAEGWEAHATANLRAPALLTQAFARTVPAGAGGLIVNLLDAKLAQPNPDFFTYTISKMGLAGLTELSARALAGRGIRVCGIAPSVTLVSGPQSRENFDAVHRMNALDRGVTVEQIVAALRFIVASPTFTGQTISLDAGQRFLGLPRDVQFMGTE
jgi:NAD(P)-dependent dehydrogenase (short-subunit alcohol dehydrogenase family)